MGMRHDQIDNTYRRTMKVASGMRGQLGDKTSKRSSRCLFFLLCSGAWTLAIRPAARDGTASDSEYRNKPICTENDSFSLWNNDEFSYSASA